MYSTSQVVGYPAMNYINRREMGSDTVQRPSDREDDDQVCQLVVSLHPCDHSDAGLNPVAAP